MNNECLSYCAKKIKRNKIFLAKVVTDLKNATRLSTPKRAQSSKCNHKLLVGYEQEFD